MQIKITNAEFDFGGETLFENLNFEVNTNDKIAIIGRNGSGKTTLLKILCGELELHQPDNSIAVFSVIGNPTIGSLKQMSFDDESTTLYSEILKCYSKVTQIETDLENLQHKLENNYSDKLVSQFSKLHDEYEILGGYTYKAEIDEVLSSFGFLSDKNKKLSEFSGGQKTKIAFIKLVLSKPDVLLLDEPTNHLDIKAVNWLETYISKYKKAVVIVSHDRTFLDNTVNVVYELEYKKFTKYIGNYTKFLQTKEQNYDSQLKAYEAQQREIADINAFIEKFRYKATKANAVQSRIKYLEKLDIIPMPTKSDNRAFRGKIKPNIESGSEVLSCTNLKIGYDKSNILATIDLKLTRGERLGIIGGNGLGKSTFLKVLTEKIPAISGCFKFGYNVEYGYFEQIESKFYSSKTIYEHFCETFPDLSGNEVRSALGAFLFSGKDVQKQLSSLSGGEIVRLELCKLLQTKPNLLILDEPTNHMDITTKETLENLLLHFEGTIIFVSHDRYFVNKLATNLLVFEENKTTFFKGTYKEFNEPFSKPLLETQETQIPKIKPEKIDYPLDFDDPKEVDPILLMSGYELGKEKTKLENSIKKLEQKSAEVEEKLKTLNANFVDPEIATDFTKLMQIQAEIEKAQSMSNKFMNDWMEQTEKLNFVNLTIEQKQNEKKLVNNH